MIVTIHQPEHFPYMGFFQKLSNADIYVILDNVKFRKNYFQNRNLIKNKNGDDEWLTVPIKNSSKSSLIKDVETVDNIDWRSKIVEKIQKNFGFDTADIYKHEKLIDINLAAIDFAFEKLNIKKPKFILASSLHAAGSKSTLLSNIVKELNGTTYLSGPGGIEYLDTSIFECAVEFSNPENCDNYSCLNHFNRGT